MANPEVDHPALSFFKKQYWTKIFVVSCMFAVMLDPLFLYIPIINRDKNCLGLDRNIKIAALVSRLVVDLFYVSDIVVQIYTSEHRPRLINEFGKRKYSSLLPTIAKMFWRLDIIIDILAIIPFPQVLIFIFFSKLRSSRSFNPKKFIMNFFLLGQYVPRVFRIYLSCKEPKRSANEESIAIWVKGLLNLFMYILASNVLGAVWYFFAIERMVVCWQYACQIENGCDISAFSCHEHRGFTNITFVNSLCPMDTADSKLFNFGIFLGILQSGIQSTNFLLKLTYCFCWALRNLSSFGSNLQPSTNLWENLFVGFITIVGLLLFIYLIGNLQTYMQLEIARKESQRHERNMKRKKDQIGQEIELWLSKSLVPTKSRDNIKSQILERVQEELDDNRNIGGLDYILSILHSPLREHIKDCLPLNRLKKVPLLQDMDEEVLKAICENLKPMKYTNDIIIKEGEPLQLMLIILDGVVSIEKSNCSGNSQRGVGQLCGENLLAWPALTSFPDVLPSAIESARAIDDVEALVLMSSDLVTIGTNFIMHYRKFRHSNRQFNLFQEYCGPAVFTEEDLKKATRDYHESRVVGQGGSATIYRGILPDKSVVAVKKSREYMHRIFGHGLADELIALRSINHPNVVRLIGCCFETELPSLVLEYIPNGSLYEHIRKTNGKGSPPLPLELRITVATEIARALAYLHSATPMIIHRDVKSANILLDENYTAKLIDFGIARLVGEAESQDPLNSSGKGTIGYLAPEFYQQDMPKAKNDVYSFGVVLMELLTSRRALDRPRLPANIFVDSMEKRRLDRILDIEMHMHVEQELLANIFVDSVEKGRLDQILDREIVNDGNFETAKKVAAIAQRCTRLISAERPSMKEVAMELEVLMELF